VITTVELFCGTKSFTKIARTLGCQTFTTDSNPAFNPDICKDILALNGSDFPRGVDILWASPPCECFSVASIGTHWNTERMPKSDRAKVALRVVEKMVNLIKEINPRYFFIENPRAMMRTLPIMAQFRRTTVTYCQYGETRMKATDIWTNSDIELKPPCKYGDKCHVPAPRGSKTGTQGMDGKVSRGVVPERLCKDIIEWCLQNIPQKPEGSIKEAQQ